MYSLSRTLVVRFSLTIFVALMLIALWAYLGTQRILHEQLPDVAVAAATRPILTLLLGTVLLGTVATVIGAGWLARVSVEPVEEIAAQAAAIRSGTTGSRITVHADVAEYSGLVEVLNRMLARLDRGLESERRIIADVGHDLRTPITVMRGEIEVALRGERSPADYRRILRSVLEEAEHLSSISEALVLLARIEAGELEPERSLTDVARVVGAAVKRMQGRAGDRPLTFSHEGDAAVQADETMLAVAVDQLLDNATRHTPDGTAVSAMVLANADGVRIVIQDAGLGVPEDVMPFLFERFYRGDQARGRGGAGLGLTICRAIAEAHGGGIAGDRSPQGGLRVTLSLPRRAGELSAA